MATTINTNGTSIHAELTIHGGADKHAAIVIAHGSDGMTPPWAEAIQAYAAALAAKGFTVLTPSYLESTATPPGAAVFAQLPVHLETWVNAVKDTVTFVRSSSGLHVSAVGLLGFSLGGHICLRLRGLASVVVEYFAPELRELGGIRASAATPFVQIHHGGADSLVPFANAESIVSTLKLEGISPDLHAYEGAGHGFIGKDPKNSDAQRLSMKRTIAYFDTHLK